MSTSADNADNTPYIIHRDYCDTSGKLGYLICKTQSFPPPNGCTMYYNENVARDTRMWVYRRDIATVFQTKAEAIFVLQNSEFIRQWTFKNRMKHESVLHKE
jgi:hypothetical protein